ncbi:hypothetical protein ACN28C_02480 [Plantactinospora sp. WMMC1484]|uniref:hypothetical protein n=1 Tax=Plantactinospora sp. WMMC1484 TaxID=3404122 RepID=UPI003BF57A46
MSTGRWVIHLPTTLAGRDDTVALLAALRGSLAHVPVLDFDHATIRRGDEASPRTTIWCDAPIGEPRAGPGSRRCHRFVNHPGPCA